MRHAAPLALILAAPLMATAQPATERPAATQDPLAPFAALAGHWTTDDDAPMHETWMPAHAGNMTGVLRWIAEDGSVRMYELMNLTAEPDGVRLRIRHFDGAMTPWKSEADGPVTGRLTDSTNSAHVFTIEPAGGSLESITYDLSQPDKAAVTLGFAEGREPVLIDFKRRAEP